MEKILISKKMYGKERKTMVHGKGKKWRDIGLKKATKMRKIRLRWKENTNQIAKSST